MPTGYTAKIIEGEITDFKDFAKLCIRNFGATMHMRDDSLDSEYIPDEVPDFYKNNIKKSEEKIDEIKKMSDEDIINMENDRILDEIKYYKDKIEHIKKSYKILNDMLKKAKNFKLPSDDYFHYRSFLIEQLESTINQDCDIEYYEKNLNDLNKEYGTIKYPDIIRNEHIKNIENDIIYYKKTYNEQKKRVERNNKWVKELFEYLEKNY